jgi:hypothetical protein
MHLVLSTMTAKNTHTRSRPSASVVRARRACKFSLLLDPLALATHDTRTVHAGTPSPTKTAASTGSASVAKDPMEDRAWEAAALATAFAACQTPWQRVLHRFATSHGDYATFAGGLGRPGEDGRRLVRGCAQGGGPCARRLLERTRNGFVPLGLSQPYTDPFADQHSSAEVLRDYDSEPEFQPNHSHSPERKEDRFSETRPPALRTSLPPMSNFVPL